MYRLVPTLTLLCAGVLPQGSPDAQGGLPAPEFGPVEAGMEQGGGGQRVANLPYARGQTFRSLDAYLAHLERQGAIGLPWWRQIGPGVYEQVVRRMPRGRPERATRAELMRRFGFTR
jgi:hypothetical protein